MTHTDELLASLNTSTHTRTCPLPMEYNSELSYQQSAQQCISPVPQVLRSCLKNKGKVVIEPATKGCVSFDLEKNEVWTIKDWTLPITLERQKDTTVARISEGWVFDGGGVDVVMTDV